MCIVCYRQKLLASSFCTWNFLTRLRESLTFVTLPETTVTSNKSYSYLHWVTIVTINSAKPVPYAEVDE